MMPKSSSISYSKYCLGILTSLVFIVPQSTCRHSGFVLLDRSSVVWVDYPGRSAFCSKLLGECEIPFRTVAKVLLCPAMTGAGKMILGCGSLERGLAEAAIERTPLPDNPRPPYCPRSCWRHCRQIPGRVFPCLEEF